MNTNSPLFITLILSGLSLVVCGWVLLRHPPKSINGIYGYRSHRSRSSQEAWDYSQPLAARLMMRHGATLSLLSIVGCLVSFGEIAEVSFAMAMLSVSCITMWTKMENTLANRFGNVPRR